MRIMKSDPPAECEELGPAYGSVGGVVSPELNEKAKLDARNYTGEMGGNYFRWETLGAGDVTGTAYRCPDELLPKAQPAPPAD